MDRRKRRQQTHNEISVRLPRRTKSEGRDSLSGLRRQGPPPRHRRKGSPPRSIHQFQNHREIRQQRRRTNHLPRTSARRQGSSRSKIQRSMRRPINGRAIKNINLPLHGSQRGRRDNNPRSNSRTNQRGPIVLSHVQRFDRNPSAQHDCHRIHGTLHQSSTNGIRSRVQPINRDGNGRRRRLVTEETKPSNGPSNLHGKPAMGKSLASPTESMIKEVSASFSEPQELSRERFLALDYFNKLPLEKSTLYTKYVDILSGLTLDSFEPGLPSHLKSIPHEIAHLVRERDEPTLSLQVDSQMVRTEVHGTLEKEGIIFSSIHSALANNPELARSHFTKAIPPDDDKFAALNNAFFTAGTFVYVPKGLNIIIAEENSKLNFLQEAYSKLDSGQQGPALYSEVTEVYVGEDAEVNFASLQNFEGDVHSTLNRRCVAQKDARMNWTIGHIGGGTTRSRVESVLDGPGASAEDVEIVFGSESQRVDAVTDLTHRSTNTTGHVLARGVLRDSARTIFKGMIRIEEGAKNSNSYLAEHAMIFSKKARADAIPGLEIMTNEVKATHSGSVSQVDEEQIFYLMSRGLTQSEAQRMIIIGFLHPAVQRIPLRTVRAAIQYLIEEKWLGRGGQIPPSPEQLPEFEEEPEKESVSSDLFERHYKYR